MRRLIATVALVGAALASLTACGGEPWDDGQLHQATAGATVYIDGTNEGGDVGDQALVEQKPGGNWVVPDKAPFRWKPSDGFVVKIKLGKGGYEVLDLGGTKVGKDHDNCREDGETYVAMKATGLKWEPADDEANESSDDDCVREPADKS